VPQPLGGAGDLGVVPADRGIIEVHAALRVAANPQPVIERNR